MVNSEEHVFKLQTSWDGGRNEVGQIECGNLISNVSIPTVMDGPGIGTNPDEMLLGAASTCYLISLATILDNSKIKAKLILQSEGIVHVAKGVLTYQHIIHNIQILLTGATEQEERLAKRIAIKAEKSCMISKALKGNVDIFLHCEIINQKL